MKFKEGQQVICVSRKKWVYRETKDLAHGPSCNQVCTIIEISEDYFGTYFLIKGYEQHGSYNSASFRPLEYGKSAISDLTKDFKESIEKTDQPIKELKTIRN